MQLSILMPCLNEAETLEICIRKALAYLASSNIDGEVLIADNGSTDGSQAIAEKAGARVVDVSERGYGAALIGGIQAANGRYIIMGDADDSYDFSQLTLFVEKLEGGADLVMGNRFRGGIAKGAMPFLHRYLGNPVLSWIGRLFFKIDIKDFHCGLRGFNRDRMRALNLKTTGMEFASEMVVRASLAGYKIEEVPTILSKDGRSRPPHLRTWRDGWRHLSFLLMYSPRWLFLYPGTLLLAIGLIGSFALFPGQVMLGNVGFDIHTFVVACMATVVGVQALSFAVIARRFASAHNLIPPPKQFESVLDAMTLDRILLAALPLVLVGIGGVIWSASAWASKGFGPLEYAAMLRTLVLSLTTLVIGIQLVLTGFLSAITEIPTR
jgi:glycosyltransferase involved in cell wall biosynthesis